MNNLNVFRANESGDWLYRGYVDQPELIVKPDDVVMVGFPDDDDLEGLPRAWKTHPDIVGINGR